jgi:hypothetical protein
MYRDTDNLSSALTRLSEALHAVQDWLDDEEPAEGARWVAVTLAVETAVRDAPVLWDAADKAVWD